MYLKRIPEIARIHFVLNLLSDLAIGYFIQLSDLVISPPYTLNIVFRVCNQTGEQ